jgi:hypothetical protein
MDLTLSEAERPGLARGDITAGIGISQLAADAEAAAVIVLLDGGEAQLLERTAAAVEPLSMIDPTRRFAAVSGDGEPLGPGASERVWVRGRRRDGRSGPARWS